MFRAALWSLSKTTPQLGQMWVRTLRDFLTSSTTGATFLAGEVWCDCNDRNIVHEPIDCDPEDERAPSCIVNRLREVMVPDHVAYLQVFIGNQIVR